MFYWLRVGRNRAFIDFRIFYDTGLPERCQFKMSITSHTSPRPNVNMHISSHIDMTIKATVVMELLAILPISRCIS